MKLLAIETAYDVCGAALVNETGVEAIEEAVAPRQHNETLAVAVAQVLARSGWELGGLDGIAISMGPGSYTGLRIGMSYVKGLAFGAGLPVVPVPTLPSLLVGESIPLPHWVATWSHGRHVFALRRDEQGQFGPVQFMPWEDFAVRAQKQLVAGHQLERFLPGSGIRFVQVYPSAGKVGKFALEEDLVPAADLRKLVPDYHHQFQAKPLKHVHS